MGGIHMMWFWDIGEVWLGGVWSCSSQMPEPGVCRNLQQRAHTRSSKRSLSQEGS